MDRKEIIEFYNRHRVWLFNVSFRITGDSMVSEEIMHDTLLAWLMPSDDKRRSISGNALNGWLKRVCINRSIDWLRKKKGNLFISGVSNSVLNSVEDPESFMEEVMRAPEMVQMLKQAISKMGAPYGVILDLVLIEGLSYEEVSQITGVKENTLRSQYSRAMAQLKELLKIRSCGSKGFEN